MSTAIPEIKAEDPNVPHAERIITGNKKQQFQLTEEEKAQQEREMRERARKLLKKREMEIKRKNGEIVPDVDDDDSKGYARQAGNAAVTTHAVHFNPEQFQFEKSLDELTNNWGSQQDKSKQLPQNLPPEIDRGSEAGILRSNSFNETYLQLCCSKNVEHVQDAIVFMVCCLRSDPIKYSQSAIALINILGQNINASLFAFAG